MSRHTIPGKNPNHKVAVGWDPPLQTYFCIILDPTKDEDDKGYTVLWVGADRPRQVDRVYDLRAAIAPYATIPEDVIRQLVVDRSRDTA